MHDPVQHCDSHLDNKKAVQTPTNGLEQPSSTAEMASTIQNRWTSEQRTVVFILFEQFGHLTKNQTRAIFNEIFDAYHRSQDIPNGLDYHRLQASYGERFRPRSIKHWRSITAVSPDAAQTAIRDEHLRSIRAAAVKLNISLTSSDDATSGSHSSGSAMPSEMLGRTSAGNQRSQQPSNDVNTAVPPQIGNGVEQAAVSSNAKSARERTSAEIAKIEEDAKRRARMRPNVEEGEDYLYMVHSSAVA